MAKKIFIKLLKELISIRKDVDALNKAFKKFEPDFNWISFGRFETLITDCLKEAMEDKEDWVGYYLYEMDCKFSKKSVGSYKDGKKIYIRNYNDLYDLIK